MKPEKQPERVFNTDRRIRLGIWGLGRGMSFYSTCKFLNIDVVAGCDYNEHMRANFLKQNPGAFATDDADKFLAQDFDAILLATFCPSHAGDAIQCLKAGKHVLSEVTGFFTMAEGVRLVEEVEKRKLVYSLAENYPFSASNMWLANRWREGLFGDMMYAEYEYVHEIRSLAYTYIDGVPVKPGHTVHNWRSWFNFHYYCTHSLGPVMLITGTRPTMVEAFPCRKHIAGYLRVGKDEGNGTMTPSLIQMNNGGLVRNLMGAATHDSHQQRIWGTRGAFEIGSDGVKLRLGGTGGSPMMKVIPKWEGLGELAENTGHGGGDFWTLYYFAREILTGKKGPFDIYGGCDVTIPGIQALRSSLEGGKPMEVPDFRKKSDRDRYRSDDWHQTRYDTKRGVFGGMAVKGKAADFTTVMKNATTYLPMARAYLDWKKVRGSLADPNSFLPVAEKLIRHYEDIKSACRDARAIIAGYPGTDGARVLSEMLELGEAKKVLAPAFLSSLKREITALRRKVATGTLLTSPAATSLLPARPGVKNAPLPGRKLVFRPIACNAQHGFDNRFYDIRSRYEGKPRDGMIYARGFFNTKRAGFGKLTISADGPYKVFLNKSGIGADLTATNPISANARSIPVNWKKGRNEVVIALGTNGGRAWGFMVLAYLDKQ